ncbi:hypothetical protein, partial [Roseinatronobacter sp.]|uniref:hypothetical protein n=1 Tax=Roseinatronobacter sp. TaxID=1945755 RepID=UPI0025F0BBC4
QDHVRGVNQFAAPDLWVTASFAGCLRFERFRASLVTRHQFSIPCQGDRLSILDVWKLLKRSFDHIEHRDPTTRIMSLKLFINNGTQAIVSYRVGAVARF